MMGDQWRLARSLGRLRTQVNDKFPGRSKVADGALGDRAHQARGAASDHNPWIRLGNIGIVTAIDITHDPRKGMDTYALFKHLQATRDRRIKYKISQRQIVSSINQPWAIRPYAQTPHTGHIHISVIGMVSGRVAPEIFDDTRDWDLGWQGAVDVSPDAQRDVLRRGSTGEDVRTAQRLLGPPLGGPLAVDGIFGPATERAVREFQASLRLRVDGIIGPRTWEHLEFLEDQPE